MEVVMNPRTRAIEALAASLAGIDGYGLTYPDSYREEALEVLAGLESWGFKIEAAT